VSYAIFGGLGALEVDGVTEPLLSPSLTASLSAHTLFHPPQLLATQTQISSIALLDIHKMFIMHLAILIIQELPNTNNTELVYGVQRTSIHPFAHPNVTVRNAAFSAYLPVFGYM
jgi:hypothetical protein